MRYNTEQKVRTETSSNRGYYTHPTPDHLPQHTSLAVEGGKTLLSTPLIHVTSGALYLVMAAPSARGQDGERGD